MKWVACSASAPGAQKMRMDQIEGKDLMPPPIEFGDFIHALNRAKKSVSAEDLIKQDQFTKEFGMEG